MLNNLLYALAVVTVLYSFKSKAYRYVLIPVLLILYELASDPGQYILFNLTDPNMIGFAEKSILILIVGLLCAFPVRQKEGKGRWLPPLFAGLAVALRFIRSIVFDWYTGQMTMPGVDAMAIHREFTGCVSAINSAIKIAVLLMLACILWQLSRLKKPEN